jgi:hypothetical protein
MSETGEVIGLFHDGWPHLTNLGELVDVARETPLTKILNNAVKHLREIERLHKIGARMSLLRHLIAAGVLVSRAVYEIYGIPAKRSHPIGPPEPPETPSAP